MIYCNDYKAFRGILIIIPEHPSLPCKELFGNWIYKPKYKKWFNGNLSFPDEICEIIEEYEE